MTIKAASFTWGPGKKALKISPGCYASCFATWANDASNPMVLEVSVVDREAIKTLWNAPVGEMQCRLLRFLRKALPLSMDNYFPFEEKVIDLLLGLHRE